MIKASDFNYFRLQVCFKQVFAKLICHCRCNLSLILFKCSFNHVSGKRKINTDKQVKMTSLIAPFLALVFAVNLAKFVLSHNEQICLPVPRDALGTLLGRGPRGPSGKRGIPGPQGTQGTKGNPGPPGLCQCDLSEVVEMRETLNRILPKLRDEVCLAGVKSGKVRDDEMTASSINNQDFPAHEGRLNGGRYWYPHLSKFQTPGEWLQVDFRTPTTVTGVVTQGSSSYWVTSFKTSFGNSTNQLQAIQDVDGNDMIFQGNTDSDTHVQNVFPNPIKAKYFRLIVVTFNRGIVLRLDYLTC
ncbi:unnamed protein product [Clavelina lepadiformis]|uniref:F5/8 type C domain-containing protein n=1 Tax=Clavelina lepadiformis TaxID=159417 RepID=A0ABP0EUN2_CLALP